MILDEYFSGCGIMSEVFRRHGWTTREYDIEAFNPSTIVKDVTTRTNNKAWNPFLACSPSDPCHEHAPRGSRTGTQGLEGAFDRGKLPEGLCEEICQVTMNPVFRDPWEQEG